MNYKDLPLEQRMQIAREYATILVEDEIPNPNIPKVLAETFYLTPQQAETAFAEMKVVFKEQFVQAKETHIWQGLVGLLVCGVCAAFYLFAGAEFGWFFLIFGIFFILLVIGSLIQIVNSVIIRFFPNFETVLKKFTTTNSQGKKKEHWTLNLLFFAILTFSFALYTYLTKNGFVDINDLRKVESLIINKPVEKKNTGGKGRSYYYELFFEKFRNEFRFYKTYYRYANSSETIYNLSVGDTVDIWVDKGEVSKLEKDDKRIDVVNIVLKGQPVLDIHYRNAEELKDNKKFFLYSSMAVIAAFLICLIWYQKVGKFK